MWPSSSRRSTGRSTSRRSRSWSGSSSSRTRRSCGRSGWSCRRSGSSSSAASCRQAVASGVGRDRSSRAVPEPLPVGNVPQSYSTDVLTGFPKPRSQVRFLPEDCPKAPGQGHLSESLHSGLECAFRAVASHGPRGGQSSDQDVTSTVGLDVPLHEVVTADRTGRARVRGPGWWRAGPTTNRRLNAMSPNRDLSRPATPYRNGRHRGRR
jgi:hypothetical protein